MAKKNKLYDLFVEASMDAHVGWLLWESAQAEIDTALGREPKPVRHKSNFDECQSPACVERRRAMAD
jgi:hypothetical protein